VEYPGAFYHVMARGNRRERIFRDDFGHLRHGWYWGSRLLVERTVARQSWIAERLAMRSTANVSQQVRRHRLKNPKLPAPLKAYLQSVKIC